MSIANRLAALFSDGDKVFARRTFGGIQPIPFKEHSLRSRIMPTPIPSQLLVPVGDADKDLLTLLVSEGDQVRKYQKLAICNNVPVHAPASGVISSLEPAAVADHKRQEQFCVGIATDGSDSALQLEPKTDYLSISQSDLIGLINDAGIIGMGGAGFSTADKLRSGCARGVELLIINAAECEPYISADEALIREHAEKIIVGVQLLIQASNAGRCIIAIEDSKPDAIAALRLALQGDRGTELRCELVVVASKYPSGAERLLIECVTGIEIAAGLHPSEEGILVQNTGTAYAVYKAVVEGEPCISRITTLCGEALKTPKNFESLLGTPANFLFELCGIQANSKQISILGGTLMGHELDCDSASVCKTTNCLIAASSREVESTETEQPCIRCGFCADVCPVRLLPQQLLAFGRTSNNSQLLEHGLLDCIECGACDYVCPSHISLVSVFQENKDSIELRKRSVDRSADWQQRFQFHQYRIKKEKDEALSRRPSTSTFAAQENERGLENHPGAHKVITPAQASKDIAAAVARVKARRDNKNK